MVDFDPASYAYQERDLGQVPNFVRIFSIKVFGVTGVPPATLGANNDVALRTDGTLGAFMYQKRGGSWVATNA